MTTTTPRIYVACLASYNAGKLHGVWIDADQDADDIRAEIAMMLVKSPEPNVTIDCPNCGDMTQSSGTPCEVCGDKGKVPSAEEWAIHDYEGFGGWKLSEHESIDAVSAYGQAFAELDEDDATAFSAWMANQDANKDYDDKDDALEAFREDYRGKFDSLADYVQDYWEECGEFDPDKVAGKGQWWHPARYIDWEAMARDLRYNGEVWTHEEGGDVFVFSNT